MFFTGHPIKWMRGETRSKMDVRVNEKYEVETKQTKHSHSAMEQRCVEETYGL